MNKDKIPEAITQYWLMDGRANYSIDDAIVLETCDTEAEARENIHDYGNDTCIVEVDKSTGETRLIYSLLWETDEL